MSHETELAPSPAIDLDQAISDLGSFDLAVIEPAIRAAQANREQITPKLIDVIETAAQQSLAGDLPRGNAHILAAFLLAEFEAREGLPALLKSLSLPGRLSNDLYGDFIHEDVPRILVVLIGDDYGVLDQIIRNREIDEFVRWSAGTAYRRLAGDGRLERSVVVQLLTDHLREAMRVEDIAVVTPLVNTLVDLYPIDAMDVINEAFDAEMVEEWIIDRDFVQQTLQRGEAEMQREFHRLGPTAVTDTFEEIRSWHCYQPQQPRRAVFDRPADIDSQKQASRGNINDDSAVLPTAKLTAAHAAGRNDPCPCGSGKKYKKCCGGRRT